MMGVPAWKYAMTTEYFVVGGRARGGVEWWKQADRSVEMQHPKGFPRLNSRAVDHLSLQKFMQGNKTKGTPQTVASVYVRER